MPKPKFGGRMRSPVAHGAERADHHAALEEAQDDGGVAGVLVDLLAAGLPFLVIFFSEGMTWTSNWKMIDALM